MRACEHHKTSRQRAGFTLIELVVSMGFTALIMVAVFQLLDVTLTTWRRGEQRRGVVEQAGSIGHLLIKDLQAMHGGQQGDVLADWVDFDTTGDALRDSTWPRIRLIRQGSAAEIARLHGPRPVPTDEGGMDEEIELRRSGLIEIAWVALPYEPQLIDGVMDPEAADRRATAVLYRGERIYDGDSAESFFAPQFFGAGHRPRVGALHEVSGGLLWMGMSFATQTSLLHNGWTLGTGLRDASASWDAWKRARPDTMLHPWNEPGAGMPGIKNKPLLPRRVRIEMEFENEKDRLRRTRLLDVMQLDMTSFKVGNGERIPRGKQAHILIDAEWMRVLRVTGDRVHVRRAERGTERKVHAPNAMVHHGQTVVTEIPVRLYSDDWNL